MSVFVLSACFLSFSTASAAEIQKPAALAEQLIAGPIATAERVTLASPWLMSTLTGGRLLAWPSLHDSDDSDVDYTLRAFPSQTGLRGHGWDLGAARWLLADLRFMLQTQQWLEQSLQTLADLDDSSTSPPSHHQMQQHQQQQHNKMHTQTRQLGLAQCAKSLRACGDVARVLDLVLVQHGPDLVREASAAAGASVAAAAVVEEMKREAAPLLQRLGVAFQGPCGGSLQAPAFILPFTPEYATSTLAGSPSPGSSSSGGGGPFMSVLARHAALIQESRSSFATANTSTAAAANGNAAMPACVSLQRQKGFTPTATTATTAAAAAAARLPLLLASVAYATCASLYEEIGFQLTAAPSAPFGSLTTQQRQRLPALWLFRAGDEAQTAWGRRGSGPGERRFGWVVELVEAMQEEGGSWEGEAVAKCLLQAQEELLQVEVEFLRAAAAPDGYPMKVARSLMAASGHNSNGRVGMWVDRLASRAFQVQGCSGPPTCVTCPANPPCPSACPTLNPTTGNPTIPTYLPTANPTYTPTTATPSSNPTPAPTPVPTSNPTTGIPTKTPTATPTAAPTATPTAGTTATPTAGPTAMPTTAAPTAMPTAGPTAMPTAAPTATPTAAPTATPTAAPTATPTAGPTAMPTAGPTATPTAAPTAGPTATATPTAGPTAGPTAPPLSPGCASGLSLPPALAALNASLCHPDFPEGTESVGNTTTGGGGPPTDDPTGTDLQPPLRNPTDSLDPVSVTPVVSIVVYDINGNPVEVPTGSLPPGEVITFRIPIVDSAATSGASLLRVIRGEQEKGMQCHERKLRCEYYDTVSMRWSADGCKLKAIEGLEDIGEGEDNAKEAVCECVHLTSFLLAMRASRSLSATCAAQEPQMIMAGLYVALGVYATARGWRVRGQHHRANHRAKWILLVRHAGVAATTALKAVALVASNGLLLASPWLLVLFHQVPSTLLQLVFLHLAKDWAQAAFPMRKKATRRAAQLTLLAMALLSLLSFALPLALVIAAQVASPSVAHTGRDAGLEAAARAASYAAATSSLVICFAMLISCCLLRNTLQQAGTTSRQALSRTTVANSLQTLSRKIGAFSLVFCGCFLAQAVLHALVAHGNVLFDEDANLLLPLLYGVAELVALASLLGLIARASRVGGTQAQSQHDTTLTNGARKKAMGSSASNKSVEMQTRAV